MLKQRLLTALVLIALLFGVLFTAGYMGFLVLIMVVFAVGCYEWANMASLRDVPSKLAYVLMNSVIMIAALKYCGLLAAPHADTGHIQTVLGAGCLWWAVALLWVQSYPASAGLWGGRVVRSLMGSLVLIPGCISLLYLRSLEYGEWLFVYVVAIVCFADTGAYFSGRAWGKSKLAAAVSPGKSWAGFWGGLVSTVVLAAGVAFYGGIDILTPLALILVTGFCALASVLGDLLESMVKRHRGIKDSSHILPGHGGVLDRIDSITAAAPWFALLLILLR